MATANGKNPPGLPLILDGNFFKVVSEEGLKVTGQCTFCPSRIMGLKTTTSNFNTHLKKMHPEKHKIYEEYKIERGQAIKKRRLSTEPNAHLNGVGQQQQRQRNRPSLEMSHRYNGNGNTLSPQQAQSLLAGQRGRPKTGLTQNVLGGLIPRRRPNSVPNQAALAPASNHLPRLQPNPNSLLVQNNVQVSTSSAQQLARSRRKELDDIVFNYVVKSLSATSVVENKYFLDLVTGLTSSSKKLLSQKSMESKINMQSLVKRNEILRTLNRSSYVCITLDMWALASEVGSTYACMTGHLVRDDLKMQSLLLNCRRFQNEPTCEKIVDYISEIVEFYNISREKICCIVTNNGSNILPTRIYQISYLDDNQDAQNGVPEFGGSIDSENHGLSNEDLVFINVGNILSDYSNDDESNGIQLPSHYDCPTQTLISVLTSATFETLSNADHPTSYIFQTAIHKCQQLWKACEFREAAEKVNETYGINLLIPDKRRWSSYLEAIFTLLTSREVLDDVFAFFQIHQSLDDNELNFLVEYVRTLKPFMDAFDVLQNDTDLFMGSFVPTITSIKQCLEELAAEELEYTKPLVEALLNGLQVPFNDIITLDINARPLIMASILHPLYKLTWIPEDKVEELRNWYLEEGMNAGKAATQDENHEGPGNKKARKSNGLKQANGMEDDDSENDPGTNILMEFINYLEAPCEQVSLKQLDKFPHVKKAFITFNTAIASSVPVERVIKFTEICLAPSRALLKDEVLENMMILKCN